MKLIKVPSTFFFFF